MSISELLADAVKSSVVTQGTADSINQHLAQQNGANEETPWYLHALVAIGAWLSAIFFIGFSMSIFGNMLWNNKVAAFSTGIFLLVVVVLVRRSAKGLFLRQLCLALSVTGHALIFLGLSAWDAQAWESGLLSLTAIVLATILYGLYSDTLHRFLSSLTAFVVTTFWMQYVHTPRSPPELVSLVIIVHLTGLAWIFTRSSTSNRYRALGYATAVSLLVLVSPNFNTWRLTPVSGNALWQTKIIFTLSLLFILRWVAGPARRHPPWLVGAPSVLLLGSITTPCVLAGLILLSLGFALQERLLTGLGLVFLPVFLGLYYYQMDLTLLQKSYALLGGGLSLLIIRVVVRRLSSST